MTALDDKLARARAEAARSRPAGGDVAMTPRTPPQPSLDLFTPDAEQDTPAPTPPLFKRAEAEEDGLLERRIVAYCLRTGRGRETCLDEIERGLIRP